MSIQQNKIRAIIEKIWSKVKEPKAMSGDGIVDAIDEVYEAGEKDAIAQYWKMLSNNGNREDWRYAFSNARLNSKFFQYPITIKPTNAASLFYFAMGSDVIDLIDLEENFGFKLDFSETTSATYLFQLASFSKIGVCDFSNVPSALSAFAGNDTHQELIYIKKIISNESLIWTGAFNYRRTLTHCIFEGVVGKSIDLRWSSLDKESLTSLMVCLSDNVSGQSCSLLKSAVDKAFESAEGANDGSTSDEWLALVGAKQNWTISLMEV